MCLVEFLGSRYLFLVVNVEQRVPMRVSLGESLKPLRPAGVTGASGLRPSIDRHNQLKYIIIDRNVGVGSSSRGALAGVNSTGYHHDGILTLGEPWGVRRERSGYR